MKNRIGTETVDRREMLRVPSHSYLGICARRFLPLRRRLERLARHDSANVQPRVRIALRPYQQAIFDDRSSGILILHWSRQIGKSFTLAAWAVDRLLSRPGRLVTVLSNSRENGAEFVAKCAEVCHLNGTEYESVDKSQGVRFQNMRMEVRIRANGKVGRIKVLAANPRTARGFSGDLILDEFAFHEDSAAIWEAAEPILASNRDFLCRIASTGNGRHNLFYRMVANGVSESVTREQSRTGFQPVTGNRQDISQRRTGILPVSGDEQAGSLSYSSEGFPVSRITRTQAHEMGVAIYDSNTREPITPEQARAQALDKRAYDQNYECSFADENLTLLSHELISAAERDDVGFICEQDWSAEFLRQCRTGFQPVTGDRQGISQRRTGFQPVTGDRQDACPTSAGDRQDACPTMGYLYVGFDVGRKGGFVGHYGDGRFERVENGAGHPAHSKPAAAGTATAVGREFAGCRGFIGRRLT